MKLFCKINSERGKEVTKSGNDWLKLVITANRKEIGQLDVSIDADNELVLDFTNDELITTNLIRGYLKK